MLGTGTGSESANRWGMRWSRPARQPGADAVHHAGGVSLSRQFSNALSRWMQSDKPEEPATMEDSQKVAAE